MGMNSYFFFFPSSYLHYWRKEEELGHHFPAHPPPKIPFSQKEQYDEKKNEISPFSISSSSSISPKKENIAKKETRFSFFFPSSYLNFSFWKKTAAKTARIGNEINPLFFLVFFIFLLSKFQWRNGNLFFSLFLLSSYWGRSMECNYIFSFPF